MSNYLSLLLGSAICASLSLSTPGLADEKRDAMVKAADNEAGGDYVRTRYLELAKRPFDSQDPRKKALIIGDSHAQDFLNTVLENQALANYQISTRYLPNICQIYLGEEDISGFIEEKNQALCAKADNLTAAKAQIAEADLVIIASSWKPWSAERLSITLKNLELKPEQTFKIVGRKSFGKINVRSYLRQTDEDLLKLRNPVDEQQMAVNNLLRTQVDAANFVDIHQLICGEGDTCPLFTPDLALISFDGGHLTPAGARYVGSLLFSKPPLAELK
ncbi:SGNH hydrolase domain-containing protein [Thiothrix eikelboomii]|uniref:SGNH hydrolase domain-containing protein n=1 Tax=Thiothrix eikelboomii TaxID=92487 RepID=UPI003BB076BC